MTENNSRDYSLDNIKCILMFCVIFGHLLEFCKLPGGENLYRLVYQFHMPCFVFLHGYFTKDTPSTFRLCKQTLQYILFQTAYLLFARHCMGEEVAFQYTTPYWILWFSQASILYPVFLYAYHLDSAKKRYAAVAISVLIALLAGFDDSVGYYLSLSRLIAFQPFFLLGYCFRKDGACLTRYLQTHADVGHILSGIALLCVAAGTLYALDENLTYRMLRHALSYRETPSSIVHRAVLFLLALTWILVFMLVIRRLLSRKIPFMSRIGANTLPVYLFHGFIMRIIRYYHPPYLDHYLWLLLITIFCLVTLGNPLLTRLIDPKPRKQKAP